MFVFGSFIERRPSALSDPRKGANSEITIRWRQFPAPPSFSVKSFGKNLT